MKKLLTIAAFSLCTLALAAPSHAQHRNGGGTVRGGATVRGGGSVVVSPRVSPSYRPYYYPRYSFGFYSGWPYYYSPYYYPYGYYGAYYGYPYAPYAYGGGEYYVNGGRGYGGVQIKDAPKDAQVYADGYYAGTVDDFDGAFQRLDLEAGKHSIEIRDQGHPSISFEVNIHPGETVTYRAK